MRTLKDMRTRRAAVVAELRGINDAPAGQDGALSAEQEARWTALKAELDGLEQRISRQELVDDADRRSAAGDRIGGTGDPALDRLAEGVGILDAVRAQMGGTDAAAGRARELSQELANRSRRTPEGLFWSMSQPAPEQRVVTAAVPPAYGASLVPVDYRADLFVDRLRNATRVRALGATVLGGLSGNVLIPRRKASATVGWVAENAPLNVSDPQFEGVTLTPKHCGGITEWSRNMVIQASPDVEQLARNDFALTLAEALDAAAVAGTGAGAQPTGILNTPGVPVVPIATNGGPLTTDAVADLAGAVQDANAAGATTGFLTNTKVKRAASKLKDANNNPFGLEVVFGGQRTEFSNVVPGNLTKGTGTNLSAVIYGTWADLMIGLWSELDILVNPYESVAYSKGNVSIRAMMTVDLAVRHPESFSVCRDVAAP